MPLPFPDAWLHPTPSGRPQASLPADCADGALVPAAPGRLIARSHSFILSLYRRSAATASSAGLWTPPWICQPTFKSVLCEAELFRGRSAIAAESPHAVEI